MPQAICGGDEDNDVAGAGQQYDDDWHSMAEQGECNDPGTVASNGNQDVQTSPFRMVHVGFGGAPLPTLPPISFGGGFVSFDAVPTAVIKEYEDE